MSEFFKALEQAEKDRRNAEAGETRGDTQRATDGLVAEVRKTAAAREAEARKAAATRESEVRSVAPTKEADARKTVPSEAPEVRKAPPTREPEVRKPVPAAEPARPRAPLADAGVPKLLRGRADTGRTRPAGSGSLHGGGDCPRLVAHVDPKSPAAEAYRALRANLEFVPGERACRNVVVTSPSVGEGKSTTAANLAVVAAQSGWRVCLVDADFRRPVLHRVFGLPNEGGFAAALAQNLPLTSVAARTAVPDLSVVVAGTEDAVPRTDLLSASRLERVLSGGAQDWDLVIYDTPPVIAVADTIHLVAQCDGVILVVRSGAIPASVLRRAARQIQQVRGRVLGVMLNRVDLKSGDDDSYGYYRAYYSGRAVQR